jgi:hypothetical protein
VVRGNRRGGSEMLRTRHVRWDRRRGKPLFGPPPPPPPPPPLKVERSGGSEKALRTIDLGRDGCRPMETCAGVSHYKTKCLVR